MSDPLQPHELQHAKLPCPSLSPRICSSSLPLSRWCYLTISSSAAPLSFCLHSFPASGSFPKSWFPGYHAAAAKSLQSCLTLCDPIDGSLPGSPIPGILQARTLEWIAISFSKAWKWKVKVKSRSCVRLFAPAKCVPERVLTSLSFIVVQLLSRVWFFATLWTAACQVSLTSLSPRVCMLRYIEVPEKGPHDLPAVSLRNASLSWERRLWPGERIYSLRLRLLSEIYSLRLVGLF